MADMSNSGGYNHNSNQIQGNSRDYNGRPSNRPRGPSHCVERERIIDHRKRESYSSEISDNSRNYERSYYPEKQTYSIESGRIPASRLDSYKSGSEGNNQNYERPSNYPQKHTYERESALASSGSYSTKVQVTQNLDRKTYDVDREKIPVSRSDLYSSESRGYEKPTNYPEKQTYDSGYGRITASRLDSYKSGSEGNSQNYERPSNYPQKRTYERESALASSGSYSSKVQDTQNLDRKTYDVDREKIPVSRSDLYRSESRGYEKPTNYPQKQYYDIERERVPSSRSDSYRSESRGNRGNYEIPSNYSEKQSNVLEMGKIPASVSSYSSQIQGNSRDYENPSNSQENQSYGLGRGRVPASSDSYSYKIQQDSQNHERPSNNPEKQSYDKEKEMVAASSWSYSQESRGISKNYETSSNFPVNLPFTSESQTNNRNYEKFSKYPEERSYGVEMESFPPSRSYSVQKQGDNKTCGNPQKRSFDDERESESSSSKYFKEETNPTFRCPLQNPRKESFNAKIECASLSIKSYTVSNRKTNQHFGNTSNFPQKESFVRGKERVPDSSNTYIAQRHENRPNIKKESNYHLKQFHESPSTSLKATNPDLSALFDIPPSGVETSSKLSYNTNQRSSMSNDYIQRDNSRNRVNDKFDGTSFDIETNLDRRESNLNPRYNNSSQDRNLYKQDPSNERFGNIQQYQNLDQYAFDSPVPKNNITRSSHQLNEQSRFDEASYDYQSYEGSWDREGNDEDMEEDEDEVYIEKNQLLYVPPPDILKQHLYYPPSAEEMALMFKDFVLFFMYKTAKPKKETNLFRIICESFRFSSSYHNLDVEDGFKLGDRHIRYCTLRYCKMMMVRGMSSFGVTKEARLKASYKLINSLAQTCYTLRMKPEYYNIKGFERMLIEKEKAGVFKIVPENLPYGKQDLKETMETFFQQDTDCELIYTNNPLEVRNMARKLKLHFRKINNATGVSKMRTTQYWRDLLLAKGQMENDKFVLVPPQGFGKNLIKEGELKDMMHPYKKRMIGPAIKEDGIRLYGPKGKGPRIQTIKINWNRRGRGKGGRRGKGGGKGRRGKPGGKGRRGGKGGRGGEGGGGEGGGGKGGGGKRGEAKRRRGGGRGSGRD